MPDLDAARLDGAHIGKYCDAMGDNALSGALMAAQGYDGALAYLGVPGYAKEMSAATVGDLLAHGRKIIGCYEINTDDGTHAAPAVEHAEGRAHAQALMADILAKGADDTTHLLPAVDEHLTATMIAQAVEYQRGFFDECRRARWRGRVGCYGFSEFVIAAAVAGVADWFMACGSAASIPAWTHIWQDNTQTDSIGGVQVDVDWLLNPLPAPAATTKQTHFMLTEA